jgi:DNA modification methylase
VNKTEWPANKVEMRNVSELVPYANNSRTHSPQQIDQIAASINEWGWTIPILVDEKGMLIAGHGRILAAQKLGIEQVPAMTAIGWTKAQKKAYVIADNKLALNADWNEELLALELSELQELDFDIKLTGFELEDIGDMLGDEEDAAGDDVAVGSMAERFMVPPFTVLNAREGWWQNRKRSWLSIGIESETGRDDDLLMQAKGRTDETSKRIMNAGGGTSVFDPVLCELAYLWFSPAGGLVLDPFSGGSVRGIVAAKVGRQYIGQDLRQEQVKANIAQCQLICQGDDIQPQWIAGDSRNIDKTCADVQADFIFSCPPYADLEVYSDDPNDLSTMGYTDFRDAYFEIIKKTCSLLKDDAFACFVVGEVRDKKGIYHNFVGDTIKAFIDAGLDYYNEAILVTSVGSLPLRAGRAFSASRKLGKTHQNILVFVKGCPKKAVQKLGEVDISAAMDSLPMDVLE